MKKVLMILGGIFAGIVVVGAGIFAMTAFNAAEADKESKAYVDQVVPIICTDLRVDTFLTYADQEVLNSPRAGIEKIFVLYDKLGKFVKFNESIGRANVSYTTQNGKVVSAQYLVKVEFETGPAQIDTILVKRDGKWKIRLFKVNSDVFLQSSLSGQNVDRYELARDVDKLFQGDQIQLRRNIQKVFSLALIRESEGKEEEAIKIYEKALEVNAANVPIQMRLAELLAKQGRNPDAAARAKIVQELAEHEDLVASAEDLLKSLGDSPAASVDKEEDDAPVQIVLVPVGKVSRRVLLSLREKLEERMGVRFTISQKEKNLGAPDRSWKYVFVRDYFTTLKEKLGEEESISLLHKLGMTLESTNNYDDRLKFIYAVFERYGPKGQKSQFDVELTRAELHVQYDVGRLLREMKDEFPLQKDSRVKGYLAITDQDLYEADSRYLFGGALPGYGVMSLKRFTSDFNAEDQNRPRLVQRSLKQALSSANLVLGIPRCGNPTCARAYPHSLQELDQKPDVLCSLCQDRLNAYKKAASE